MTYREKFWLEKPAESIMDNDELDDLYCPHDFGYEPSRIGDGCYISCKACWDREIEEPQSLTGTTTEPVDDKKETTGMTYIEKVMKEHPELNAEAILRTQCPSVYGYDDIPECEGITCGNSCKACWDRKFEEVKEPKTDATHRKILDSGNRREFETGAVRDIQEGKGRCDLLPLDVVAILFSETYVSSRIHDVFYNINNFQETGDIKYLVDAILAAEIFEEVPTLTLEVSKHFEEGAKKYGDNNWRKGIPVRCYIDSAVRHYLKFLRGDADEPHDRAFCWNLMCAIWTCKHKPELNDYAVKKEEKEE